MGVPDHEIDEPDERICEEHQERKPCRACAADAADRELDARRCEGDMICEQ